MTGEVLAAGYSTHQRSLVGVIFFCQNNILLRLNVLDFGMVTPETRTRGFNAVEDRTGHLVRTLSSWGAAFLVLLAGS